MQEQEIGDGTNFVIILAGALLHEAEELLRMVMSSVHFGSFDISLWEFPDL